MDDFGDDDLEKDDSTEESNDRRDLGPAFTPRQILGGFALLAALIVLLNRRRRRDREGDDNAG